MIVDDLSIEDLSFDDLWYCHKSSLSWDYLQGNKIKWTYFRVTWEVVGSIANQDPVHFGGIYKTIK